MIRLGFSSTITCIFYEPIARRGKVVYWAVQYYANTSEKTIFVVVEYPQYPDIKDIKGTVS